MTVKTNLHKVLPQVQTVPMRAARSETNTGKMAANEEGAQLGDKQAHSVLYKAAWLISQDILVLSGRPGGDG